jgi:hypothetical protein
VVSSTLSRPADTWKSYAQGQFAAGLIIGKDDFHPLEMLGSGHSFRVPFHGVIAQPQKTRRFVLFQIGQVYRSETWIGSSEPRGAIR